MALVPSNLGGKAAVGYGIAVDPEGRIVVAGTVTDSTGAFHLAVWRFDKNGAADKGFGTAGFNMSSGLGWAWSLALDSKGRSIAAGITGNNWKTSEGAIVQRFDPDGRPDGSTRLKILGGPMSAASAVRVDAQDRVLIAGSSSDESGRVRPFVARLTEDMKVDDTFGKDGRLILPVPDGASETRASALARPPEGGWLAAGTSEWRRLTLWKFTEDGKPIKTWGKNGLALGTGMGRGIVTDVAGSAWVGGFAYVYEGERVLQELAVATRFSVDGSSRSFTLSGGKHKNREAFSIVRATGGLLFLGGYSGDKPIQASLWAIDADGSPAKSFGKRGVLLLPNARSGEEDRVYALALDPQGRLLAAGFSRGLDEAMHLAVWRILP